ncbi:MAG: DUF4390 domain-containing protein [Methylotenera sp.]|nr:DUF4390 domain-containing protein [Methylotenera sp.]MSP99519.1 DUF4390 domain-containing protein [Methylotenera sp.]
MLCYKKIKYFLCLLVFFSTAVLAGNSSLNVKSAELVALEEGYTVNAELDIEFSNAIEEAVSKGFELNFIIEFQLARPRRYWFDDEVVTITRHVSLSYHALSRQYLLVRGDQQKTFLRLDEAVDDLSMINDLKVFQKTEVEKGEPYKATFLMRLDAKKLPKTLQGESVGPEDWKLNSQRFEWVPNLFK